MVKLGEVTGEALIKGGPHPQYDNVANILFRGDDCLGNKNHLILLLWILFLGP